MRKLSHWLEELSPSESVDLLRTLALTHSELGGDVGAEITKLIRSDNVKALVGYDLDYSDPRFKSVEEVRNCRQATAFFSKLRDLDIGVNKQKVAMDAWVKAEDHCKETNALFKMRARGEFQFSKRVESAITAARRKIALVLGELPKLVDLQYRVGPGATTAVKKKDANPRQKFQAGIQCSEGLFPYAKYVLEEMPHLTAVNSIQDRTDEDDVEWSLVPIDIVYGRLDFVRKSAKTDRITVVEPLLNSMVQLALGDHMTRRLAMHGLDLKDQGINQSLAREGSLTGALATLDQKSASDTISRELVFELLPLDWAHFLYKACTVKITLPTGEVVTQEKFSSMGNGFTFPLESLLFWALAKAVMPSDAIVNVFGDDVVCPTVFVPQVIEVFTAMGFWVNKEKSFWTGCFRESCGKDFYSGTDIRPYYQKDMVSARTLFLLHNFYVRRGDVERSQMVQSWIHPSLSIFGPDGYGDGHLLGVYTPRRSVSHTRKGYSGHLFSTFTVRARRDIRPRQRGDFVLPHYTVYRRSSGPVVRWCDLLCKGDPNRVPRAIRRYQDESLDVSEPSLAIPEKMVDELHIKAVSLPGEDGYKMISIYTLGS